VDIELYYNGEEQRLFENFVSFVEWDADKKCWRSNGAGQGAE